MSKDKTLRYRIICPICGKVLDVREGKKDLPTGQIICEWCYKNMTRYKLLDEY